MSVSFFNNIKIVGIKTVVPEHFVEIDDEIQFFGGSLKKLERAKKMMGYGRRYLADLDTTVTDLCVFAAEKLFEETKYRRQDIDLLIFVNQKPDYREPCDACIAHGLLELKKDCPAIDILQGCSGYVYGLWLAHSMMMSGVAKKCLLLAGDIASYGITPDNRKLAQLFGDAASATLLEYTDEERSAVFSMGSDGGQWDKIVTPFGGIRLAPEKNDYFLKAQDDAGNIWTYKQPMVKGEDVFNFTLEVAPKIIRDVLDASRNTIDTVDYFAIHQANKQIVDAVAERVGVCKEKASSETFSKYANNSTNSVVTVLCDQLLGKNVRNVVLCAFGIGLSWGCCLLNMQGMYNGGISLYKPTKKKVPREEQINHWIKYFKGE